MKTCRNCGKQNADEDNFCIWCGEKLEAPGAAKTPPRQEPNGKICPRCSAVNEEDDNYCCQCGAELVKRKPQNPKPLPGTSTSKPDTFLYSPSGKHWGIALPLTESRSGVILHDPDLLSEEGGQGVVYRVSYQGETKVLKVYRRQPSENARFKENLISNLKKGSPDESFIWPIDVVENIRATDSEGPFTTFGYVMDLFPKDYVSVAALNKGKQARFEDDYVRARAILRICTAFKRLHNRGYSYQDINAKNIIIHPKTGKIRIGDVDNIAPNATDVFVEGTPRYMAPEIVRDRKNTDRRYTAGVNTDDYSLAVLIFMLFFRTHPLEGENFFRLREKKEEKAASETEFIDYVYGFRPCYVLDHMLHPEDYDGTTGKSRPYNGPLDKVLPYLISKTPDYLMDAFARSFSRGSLEGIPNAIFARTTDSEWEHLFLRLQAQYHRCSDGNYETFRSEGDSRCPHCGRELGHGKRIRLGNEIMHDYTVPAEGHRMIARSQFGPCKWDDEAEPVLWLTNLPNGMTALQNTSKSDLTVCFGGEERRLPPKGAIPAVSGITVKSDNGEVEFL